LEFGGMGIPAFDPATAAVGTPIPAAFFFFQLAFAATAATIVSGAVAGRLKFSAYLMYSAFISAIVYPISGFWGWGGGWIADMGFKDFAGSIVVHSVGGFAGLAGAILLGPRIGRFVNGKTMPIPGHNLTFAALGVFILWIGWYGFNPASQILISGIGNTSAVVYIAVTTTLGGAAGALIALAVSWVMFGKPDMTMALNGALAGLVGVTANCNAISYNEAFIIGGVAGVIVVLAIVALEKLQIDDPVGAFPVHGCCGLWGGISTGIFADGAVMSTQIIGTLAVAAWAFGTMLAFFGLLKVLGQLRVSKEEELEGLDISEHGMYAYPAHHVHEGAGASSYGIATVCSAKTPVGV
ncbi:MAG TPA: ammonium transporter, partial [Pirellulaceae bacterium]|nr:ammonium transporter [Pirellulaceae bacterium]